MKYVVGTIIGFIIITVVYASFDYFKDYLFKKYKYEFYKDNLIYLLIFCEITGVLAIGLHSVGIPYSIFAVLATICIIVLSLVVINNIKETSVLCGILVTLFQGLYGLYISLLVASLMKLVEDNFSSKNDS